MPHGPGCIVDSGIITEECELTPKAKKKFIQDVKDELTYGTDNLPVPPLFPCGVSVPPNPFAHLLELENEEKFPEFHKNILGSYKKIACQLNLKSDCKLLPICCPIALGFKLGVKIKIPNFPGGFVPFMIPNAPLLALKMKVMPPPKLIKKFPDIPAVPPPIPKFDIPPDIKFPDFNTFFDFTTSFSLGIPKLLGDIVLQMPKLALKMPNLPDVFKAICEIAHESKLFGDISPGSVTEIVAVKVLTRKIVEMTFITAVGTTLGSAPGGLTGGIGRLLEYEPPDDNQEEEPESTRDKIVQAAEECINLSWGGSEDDQDLYAQKMLYVEYPEPDDSAKGDQRSLGKDITIEKLKDASSCGLFARWCLFSAGASYVKRNSKVDTSRQDPTVDLYYDFFKDRYREGDAIDGILQAAIAKNATIQIPRGELPPLKKGDVIIVHKNNDHFHAIVLIEDYEPGSLSLTTVEGGQSDENNGAGPTAIKRIEYISARTVSANSSKRSIYIDEAQRVVIAGRYIYKLIDGEILCNDQTGSDMSNPANTISVSTTTIVDGPGDGFQQET